jgi:hypothetical protein
MSIPYPLMPSVPSFAVALIERSPAWRPESRSQVRRAGRLLTLHLVGIADDHLELEVRPELLDLRGVMPTRPSPRHDNRAVTAAPPPFNAALAVITSRPYSDAHGKCGTLQ